MPLSLEELKAANDNGLDSLKQSLDRLRKLRPGALPSVLNQINAKIQFATTEITHIETVRAHLDAAGVTVKELSQEDEATLRAMSNKLDDAIRTGAIASAAFDFAGDIIAAAKKVGDLTEQKT